MHTRLCPWGWAVITSLHLTSCILSECCSCKRNTSAQVLWPTSASFIRQKKTHLHVTGTNQGFMLNCRPEACVMVGLWQGCRTEGLHFPPSSLPPCLSLSISLLAPPFITMADGCRWIPHNHVRTAPPIPIHLFKHISSDGELHKDKGGRQTTKAHKDCPCKQVFLVPNTT